MRTLTLLALALAPGCAIMVHVYIKDMYEKEPIGMLAGSFAMGCLSVGVTIMVSLAVRQVVRVQPHVVLDQLLHAFALVALIEEGSKYLFVRGVCFRSRHFNEPFDGIVYAVMVGMGFATVENIAYVFHYGIGTGIARMFTAVPAHATFGVVLGYYLGLQKFNPARRYLGRLGLFWAVIFHGFYDFFLFIAFVPGASLGALVSLLIMLRFSKQAIIWHQQLSPFRKACPGLSEPCV